MKQHWSQRDRSKWLVAKHNTYWYLWEPNQGVPLSRHEKWRDAMEELKFQMHVRAYRDEPCCGGH